MFALPWRKKRAVKEKPSYPMVELEWLKPWIETQDFVSPNWEEVDQYVETHLSHEEPNQLWSQIARNWAHQLLRQLPSDYTLIESENFILLSNESSHYNASLSAFLERCRVRLLRILKGITADNGWGKHLVIMFGDIDHYYDYVSQYGPQEGTYGLSSGMYLNYGYGHFVFQHDTLDMVENIAAHEMTHALLSHLPIPLWLNEGMAVNMESLITGQISGELNRSMFQQHQNFWDKLTIQEFWQGASFSRPDEGQRLSYQLAQLLVSQLSKDYDAFVDFVNQADWRNAGESAMESIYGQSLGNLIIGFLGEGNWQPRPQW